MSRQVTTSYGFDSKLNPNRMLNRHRLVAQSSKRGWKTLDAILRRIQLLNAYRYPKGLFDVLESRVLLSSTLLNITNHTDMILDSTRNQIDIVSSNGVIHRYDANSGKLLADIIVTGATFNRGDITVDGKFLYLTDGAGSGIYKIELNTGLSSYIATPSNEGYAQDLVVLANNTAIFTTGNSTGGWTPLHQLDLSTDTFTAFTTPTLNNLYAMSELVRSADRNTVYIDQPGGSKYIYDAITHSISQPMDYYTECRALNSDGSLIATKVGYTTSTMLWDQDANAVGLNLPAGALCFSPDNSLIYILQSNTSTLLAYDTATYQLKATIDIGEVYASDIGVSNAAGTGLMTLSADGKTILIATNKGVRTVKIDPDKFTTTTLSVSSQAIASGTPLTLLATVNGQATYNGSVIFKDGSTVLAAVKVTGSSAIYTIGYLSSGVHDLTATFVDAASGIGSTSRVTPVVALSASAASNLLPIASRGELVYDSTRNIMNIVCTNGDIFRYDMTWNQLLSAFHVDAGLGASDISVDGKYLYACDASMRMIHQIDLSTGARTDIAYKTTESYLWAAADFVVLSDSLAIFSCTQSGSGGSYALYALNLQTGLVTPYTAIGTFDSGISLDRSSDRSTMTIGGKWIYDVNRGTIVNAGEAAVAGRVISSDGSLFVADSPYSTTNIYNQQGTLVRASLPGGAAYFSPASDTLFIAKADTSLLYAYDTTTFACKFVIDTGEIFDKNSWDRQPGSGKISASADGRMLFIASDSGVRIVRVDESKLTSTQLTSSAPAFGVGQPVTLSVTLQGQSTYNGRVVFYDGTSVLGSVAATSNHASLTVTTLGSGIHNLTACFMDSATGMGSESNLIPLIVKQYSGMKIDSIPLTNRHDMIVDNTRNQLLIVGDNGNIFRYDATTFRLVAAIHIDGSLGQGDITVDGHYLYLTDTIAKVIHKVDLVTGSSSQILYTASWINEQTPYDLVIVSDSLAIFSGQSSSSWGQEPLHFINLQTDETGLYTSGPLSAVNNYATFSRSADRQTVLITSSPSGNNIRQFYDVASGTFSTALNSSKLQNAMNADGSLFATTDSSTTTIRDRFGNAVKTGLPSGTVCFNPVRNVLYIKTANYIYSYDTTTFENIDSDFFNSAGQMIISADGNSMFVATSDDIHVVNIVDEALIKPVLTVSTPQPTYGQSLTLTASLPPEAGFLWGDFTFMADGVALGKVSPGDSNSVSFTTTKLTVGVHSISVVFNDNYRFRHYTSDVVQLTVAQAAANVQVQLDNEALPSRPLSFSVHVTGPGSVLPSGKVDFYSGDVYLGSDTLFAGYASYSSGQPLPLGVYSITAVYSGDSNYLAATSESLSVNIYQSASEVQWQTQPMTVPNDEPFILKFGVSSSGLTAATGNVSIFDGDTLINSVTLDANGNGAITIPAPGTGTHRYRAVYNGSVDMLPSTSSELEITAKVIPPVLSTTNLYINHNTVEADSAVRFTANIWPAGYPSASGTVSFYDGNVLLATVSTDARNKAEYSTSDLSVGHHEIFAVYNGSLRVAASSSSSLITVTPVIPRKTTMHLSIDDASIATGAYAAFGVAFDSVDGFVPKGTVSFYDGSKLLGSSVVDENGYTGYGTFNLAAGTHTIKAVYNGSGRFASTSATVKQTIYQTYTVDLLVLFTGDEADAGSYERTAQKAIDQTNEVMANSDIGVTIRLVGVQWVNYTESGNYTTDITRLTTSGDHYLDEVSELRRLYHADLVSLFVNEPEYDTYTETLGIATTLEATSGDSSCAYSVISTGDADNYVLAHEIGHNFGARHESRIDSSDRGFANGHGYEFKDEWGDYYHDVMAYGRDDSTIIPYYSSPNIYYEGKPIGSSSANAAAVIQRNAKYIARYSDGLGGIRQATEPLGAITATSPTTITGWAYDANLGNKAVAVRIMIDGVMGQTFYANLDDASLEDTLGSTKHGFVYKIPNNIAVGDHEITLMVQDSPGTSWVSLATQKVHVDVRPDLAISIGSTTNPLSTYVPGDAISVPITITNHGATNANGTKDDPITVTVYLTTGAELDATRITVATIQLPYSIAAGASRTINVNVPLTISLAAGTYMIGAEVKAGSSTTEADDSNNIAIGGGFINFAWEFGNIAGRKGSAALVLNDLDGTRVTLKLSGPGTGTLILGANGYDIQIDGSTIKSSFNIATQKSKTVGDDARFTLHNLIVGNYSDLSDYTSLNSITAKTTDITGSINVGGALLTLVAADMLSDSAIRVGRYGQGGSGNFASGTELSMSLGRVSDLSIESSIAIKSLSVVEWLNDTAAEDVIRTSYIRAIKVTGNSKLGIAGDFDAELDLSGANKSPANTLGTVNVAGEINSVAWNVLGSAGSIVAKTIATGWSGSFQNGNIGSIKLTGKQLNHALNLKANSLAKLEVYGNLVSSSITLDQDVSKSRSALGSVWVSGDIIDTVIRADGNVGVLSAQSLKRSGVYLGVQANLTGLAENLEDFVATSIKDLPVLTKLSLTGGSLAADYAIFDSSYVDAGSIKSVVFAKKNTYTSGTGSAAYGFATLGGTTSYSGPVSGSFYISPVDSTIKV